MMQDNCQFLADIRKHFWEELGVPDRDDDLMSNLYTRGSERTIYLEKAFILHQMVDIINCLSEHDLNNAKKTFYEYKNVPGVEMAVMADIDGIGKIYLIQGWVIMKDLNMLLSRDMLLMIKDIMFARHFALTAVRLEYPEGYYSLSELYHTIDKVMIKNGVKGYKLVKMLEPMCIDRIIKIGAEKKPLVPQNMEFDNYIKSKLKELYDDFGIESEMVVELLTNIDDPQLVTNLFGVFRHWGHPFIEYEEGLKKMHKNTHEELNVDYNYSEVKADYFIKKVLLSMFEKNKIWYIDKEGYIPDRVKHYINNNLRIPDHIVLTMDGEWIKMKVIPCFEIPATMSHSELYADKSYSIGRRELAEHLIFDNSKPIPSMKVLLRVLKEGAFNLREIVERYSKNGVLEDDLILALTVKEKELNDLGRMFVACGWDLRLYFVISEYLIKKFFVQFFPGMTVNKSYHELLELMRNSTKGQISPNDDILMFLNGMDFEKWNNKQRYENTGPLFRAMDAFLGMPNFIERTHLLIKQCIVYYKCRPDLMTASYEEGLLKITSLNDEYPNMWDGTMIGGVEGQRQTGWGIDSAINIELQTSQRNVQSTYVLQGDNQIIINKYKIHHDGTENDIRKKNQECYNNNRDCLNSVYRGIEMSGLSINKDETTVTCNVSIYGKDIIVHENAMSLSVKRFSSSSGSVNDPLPTLADMISNTNSNCLTAAQGSDCVVNATHMYAYMAPIIGFLVMKHNPTLQNSGFDEFKDKTLEEQKLWWAMLVYCDPSIGGVGGCSLTRFLIRGFPDPVTESLSFAKICLSSKDPLIKRLGTTMFDVQIDYLKDDEKYWKLFESPTCLNLKGGMNIKLQTQDAIRVGITNMDLSETSELIQLAFRNHDEYRHIFLNYALSIKPRYGQLLSRLKEASPIGLIDSITGSFTNSATFKQKFEKDFPAQIATNKWISETQSIRLLFRSCDKYPDHDCATHATVVFRLNSWGPSFVGSTVAFPTCMLGKGIPQDLDCPNCDNSGYVSTLFPGGFKPSYDNKGKYSAYVGSKTRVTDVKMRNWERWTEGSPCTKSVELRELSEYPQFGHFTFTESIKNLIMSLTGQDFSIGSTGFRCTGNPLHRCNSTRQNNGGSASTNLNLLGFPVTTTEPLGRQIERNSYMMHQSTILYAQGIAIAKNLLGGTESDMHFHTECNYCCSSKEELEQIVCTPIPVVEEYQRLGELLGYDSTRDVLRTNTVDLKTLDKKKIKIKDLSYQMGLTHAFTICFSHIDKSCNIGPFIDKDIHDQLIVSNYLEGLKDGIWYSSYYSLLFTRVELRDKEVCKKLALEEVSRLLFSLRTNEDLKTCLLHKRIGEHFQSQMKGPTINLSRGVDNIHSLFTEYVLFTVRKKNFLKIPIIWIFEGYFNINYIVSIAGAIICLRAHLFLYGKQRSTNLLQIRTMKEVVSVHKSQVLHNSDPPLPDLQSWTEVIERMKLVQVNLIQHLDEIKFKKIRKMSKSSNREAAQQLELELQMERHLVIPDYKEIPMKIKELSFAVSTQEYPATKHRNYDPLFQSTVSLGNPSFLAIEAYSLLKNENNVTILGDRNFEVTLPLAISNPLSQYVVVPSAKPVHYDNEGISSKIDRQRLLGLDKLVNITMTNDSYAESNRLTISKTYHKLMSIVRGQYYSIVLLPRIMEEQTDYISILGQLKVFFDKKIYRQLIVRVKLFERDGSLNSIVNLFADFFSTVNISYHDVRISGRDRAWLICSSYRVLDTNKYKLSSVNFSDLSRELYNPDLISCATSIISLRKEKYLTEHILARDSYHLWILVCESYHINGSIMESIAKVFDEDMRKNTNMCEILLLSSIMLSESLLLKE